MAIADLRKEYTRAALDERSVDPDAIAQFRRWFDEALAAALPEPNAMTLATATSAGEPAARIVLLKGVDERGFVFFTNYESAKGRDLAENPRAALVFHWVELERQVRVSGRVARLSRDESSAYFHSRPLASQLGAWVSKQSRPIASRAALEERMRDQQTRFAGKTVPIPPYWGGYVVAPDSIEFWQGRPSRLHDRLRYLRQREGGWKIERLAP